MVNGKYETTEDMNKKTQSLKGNIKLELNQKISKYYDELNIRGQIGNFRFEEHVFSKGAPGNSKTYHEVMLSLKFLQTKPRVKNMKLN